MVTEKTNKKVKTSIYEAIKNMSKEELAAFLYANCGYLDAEYGKAGGWKDSSRLLRLLDTDIKRDW